MQICRLSFLPEFRARARASAGGAGNFLEYAASIDTGAWGKILSSWLGLGFDVAYRQGAPWAHEVFNEPTFVGLLRYYGE
jgi:hypothetical protein